MDRAEFLRELEEALAGEVSPATAAENLRYYDAYIAEEAAKGRDEAEVIEEIGGPRIIARTIIGSQGGGRRCGVGASHRCRGIVAAVGLFRKEAGGRLSSIGRDALPMFRPLLSAARCRPRWPD